MTNARTQEEILEELETSLKEQIRLAKQGNLSEMEASIEHAGTIVKQISEAKLLDKPQFRDKRTELGKLYKDLSLALSASKAETAAELNRVRRGKKTIETYRANI